MAQPAPIPVIPFFAPADLAHTTVLEWITFRDDVDVYYLYINPAILALDPNAQLEATPATFVANPNAATVRLAAASATTAWLY